MNFPITTRLMSNLPKEAYRHGVGEWEGVVAHATANYGDTAEGERGYEAGHWQDAFVHFFVDDKEILNVADINYLAWGAGHPANQRFVHVELCQTHDPVLFKDAYDRWIFTLAHVLYIKKLGVEDRVTLWSHKEVSEYLGNTDHTDPIEYLASHGIEWNNVVEDVKRVYNELELADNPPKPQPKPQPTPVAKPQPVEQPAKPAPKPQPKQPVITPEVTSVEKDEPTLRKGDKGDAVKALQELLNSKMKSNLIVDGDFGLGTESVVMNFQHQKGLLVDGIVGKATWEALFK